MKKQSDRVLYGAFLPMSPCTPATREALKRTAKARKTTMAAILRAAVEEYLAKAASEVKAGAKR